MTATEKALVQRYLDITYSHIATHDDPDFDEPEMLLYNKLAAITGATKIHRYKNGGYSNN